MKKPKKRKYKDPPKYTPYGSKDHLIWGQVALFEQTKLLEKAHLKLLNPKDDKSMAMALTLISMFETSRSILLISRENVRDSFALSRILLDCTLNLGLYSMNSDLVNKALKYGVQKSFRDIFRNFDLNNFETTSKLKDIGDLSIPDTIKEAYLEFTGNKGQELRQWSQESKTNVYKRIEIISKNVDERVGDCLKYCVFSIYRHASEIIHGTLFGSFYGLGMTSMNDEKVRNKKDYNKYVTKSNSNLMVVLNILLSSALNIVGKDYPIEDLIKDSVELNNDLVRMTTKKKI